MAASSALAAAEGDLSHLPGPLSAHELQVGPFAVEEGTQSLVYEDCVEITLLRLLQAFTGGEIQRFAPRSDLRDFVQASNLKNLSQSNAFYVSDDGLKLRADWAAFLAQRPGFIYRQPLDRAPKTHEVKASWTNVTRFFGVFFPALGEKMAKAGMQSKTYNAVVDPGATVIDAHLQAICQHFEPGFTCGMMVTHGMINQAEPSETKQVIQINIHFKQQPYLKWTIWEKFKEGTRISGDMYLEDLRKS